ncbi:MAG: hypothetical protein JW940_11520 [Polyangiaceae bacterium]|nr:hypothetical protein [Polyangiaceae bacterium]
MRHQAIGVMTWVLGSLTLAPSARADVAPPDDYVETCTVAEQQNEGEECLLCQVTYADFEACSTTCGSLGFTNRCKSWGTSVYNEVYCRSATLSDGSCETVDVALTTNGNDATLIQRCLCADGTSGAAGAGGESSFAPPIGGAAGDDTAGAAGSNADEDAGGKPGTGGDTSHSASGKPGTGGKGSGGREAVSGGTSNGDSGGDTGAVARPAGGTSGSHTGGTPDVATGGTPGAGGAVGVGGKTGEASGGTPSSSHTGGMPGAATGGSADSSGDTNASKRTAHHDGCAVAPEPSSERALWLVLVALALGLRRRR